MKSLSYDLAVVSPFHSNMFHFRAKLFKIFEIFFSCENKTNEIQLVAQECKHIQPHIYYTLLVITFMIIGLLLF